MLTDAQKKERLLGIGGSDVGYIAGLSSYKSPLDLYLIKTGQKEDDEVSNEACLWGDKLEPIVAEEYATRNKVEIFKPESAIVHPEYYWMRCNLDFVVKGSKIVGEVKTAGFLGKEWGEELTEDIPYPYLLQCAHNAIVSEHLYGTEEVHLPVLSGGFGGLKQKIYVYQRNKKLEDSIINMTRKFWQEHVELRIPPQPKTLKEAASLYESNDEKVEIATDEVIEAINILKSIKAQLKELEEKKTTHELTVCRPLKEASMLVDSQGNKLATWKSQTSKRLNSAAAKSLVEIYLKSLSEKVGDDSEREKYYVESKSRVLRIA